MTRYPPLWPAFVVLILGIALIFSACAREEPGRSQGIGGVGLVEQKIELTDGRIITCVKYTGGYAGGLSCDWSDNN